MDDTTRGVGDEAISGRTDESTRDYAAGEGRQKLTDPSSPNFTSPAARTRTTAGDSDETIDDTDRRASVIRAEIAQTREELSETIDAIQEKLRPGNIVAEATDRLKQATTERVRQMAGTASESAQSAIEQTRYAAGELVEGARQNAIPAALIGIGAAWLLIDRFRRNRRDASEYGRFAAPPRRGDYMSSDEYYRSGSADYDDTRSGRDTMDRASQMATEAREVAARTGRRARNQFQRLLRENPLMVGAAAMLVGAAVGMALPETERENEWLGETKDNVVDRAQDLARDAAARVREAAGDIAGQVTSDVVSGKDTQT
jgi:hypothetical protein